MTNDICRSYNHLGKKNALFEFKNPYVRLLDQYLL